MKRVCVCVCARTGNYRTQLYDKQKEEYLPATQGLGMFVEVKDPDEKVTGSAHHVTVIIVVTGTWLKQGCLSQVILSRQYGSEGRFTLTSHTPGEHQICLHSNSSKFSLFAGGMLVRRRHSLPAPGFTPAPFIIINNQEDQFVTHGVLGPRSV